VQLHVHTKGLHGTKHDTAATCRQLKAGSNITCNYAILENVLHCTSKNKTKTKTKTKQKQKQKQKQNKNKNKTKRKARMLNA
jgi:hypothetical protein